MKSPYTVISVGGSLIVPTLSPEGGVDTKFLLSFKELIANFAKQGRRFVLVAGGGRTTRVYQKAARDLGNTPSSEQDWLGIFSTKLNARLLVTLFGDLTDDTIIDHEPTKEEVEKLQERSFPIVMGCGWLPGNSSDHVAVSLAVALGAKEFVNASNIAFVYDKDPNKYPDATPFKELSWAKYRSFVPAEWTPGLSSPIDPIAAKKAEEHGIAAKVVQGSNLEHLRQALEGASFEGTYLS